MNRITREEAVEKLESFAPMVVDDIREAIYMAIEALQYLQEWGDVLQGKPVKHGRWIPVSERLPKNDDWVIVTILDEYGDTPYRYTEFGWYLEAANCWVVGAEQRTDVTAWMPLPEPYRKDDEA